jgi:Na+/H+ antiporter NhaB
MSLTPQFISIEVIKDQSVINENVDSKLLQPTLIMVQDIYLKQVIGKELYAELITQVNAESVSALNTTLLTDYIQPYLINKVVSELVIDVNYKIKNKALMVGSSDNAQPLDNTGMSIIQTKYRNIAENYRVNLVDYLLDNYTDYPLYKCVKNYSEIPNINVNNARRKKGRYL